MARMPIYIAIKALRNGHPGMQQLVTLHVAFHAQCECDLRPIPQTGSDFWPARRTHPRLLGALSSRAEGLKCRLESLTHSLTVPAKVQTKSSPPSVAFPQIGTEHQLCRGLPAQDQGESTASQFDHLLCNYRLIVWRRLERYVGPDR